MLEILMLIGLTRKIGAMVEAKGQRSGLYKLITVFLWIGGEVLGFVVGTLADAGGGAYAFALIGAALGAGVSFMIANAVAPAPRVVSPDARVFD